MVNKDTRNFISLITGVILILLGLGGISITLPTQPPIIFLPVISLLLGAIFALMGGLRKW